jgi:50S ribosomal subunit-associated GTPase HflX
MVLNKVDLVEPETARGLAERFDGVALSAQRREGLDELIREAEERLQRRMQPAHPRAGYDGASGPV